MIWECTSIYFCVLAQVFVPTTRGQVIGKRHIILSRLQAETKAADAPLEAAENKAGKMCCVALSQVDKKIHELICVMDIVRRALS